MVKCTKKGAYIVYQGEDGDTLRRRLERSLRRELFDVVWQDLEQELVPEYQNGTLEEDPEEAWRVLKEAAERRMQMVEGGIREHLRGEEAAEDASDALSGKAPTHRDDQFSSNRAGNDSVVETLAEFLSFVVGPKSTAMLRATSEYFGWLANQHPKVVQFREEVLGGRVATQDEARELLTSYAARFFPLKWFAGWRIPILGHTSEIVGEYDWGPYGSEVDHRVTIQVDPPGIIKRVRYAHPDTPMLDEESIPTRWVLENGVIVPPYRAEMPENYKKAEALSSASTKPSSTKPSSGATLGPAILVQNYETPSRPMSVWPGSVVDELYVLAEELADTFRWPGEDAGSEPFRSQTRDATAEFVLTGAAPTVRPLEARSRLKRDRYLSPQWRIELTVSPWVSADEVSRAYKRMQDRVMDGRNQLPSPITLEVARFVWEQERLNGHKRPSWAVLLERWNKEHPEARFKDYRHFRTYCMRGVGAVMESNFHLMEPNAKDLGREALGAGRAATVQQPGQIT